MGSRGTGRLTDYPGRRGGGGGGGGGRSGGSSGEDPCQKAIVEQLEEIARCDYFRQHKQVPKVGTKLQVDRKTRIRVLTGAGEVVGYLPTKYNYLAACLASGISYLGVVQASANTPTPTVLVALNPK